MTYVRMRNRKAVLTGFARTVAAPPPRETAVGLIAEVGHLTLAETKRILLAHKKRGCEAVIAKNSDGQVLLEVLYEGVGLKGFAERERMIAGWASDFFRNPRIFHSRGEFLNASATPQAFQ